MFHLRWSPIFYNHCWTKQDYGELCKNMKWRGGLLSPRFAGPRLATLTCLMYTLLPWPFLIMYLPDRVISRDKEAWLWFPEQLNGSVPFSKVPEGSLKLKELSRNVQRNLHPTYKHDWSWKALCGNSITLAQLTGISPPFSHPLSKYSWVQKHCCVQGNYLRSCEIWDSWSISIHSLSLKNIPGGRYLLALFISEMVRIHSLLVM